jgi:hypothetical protein
MPDKPTWIITASGDRPVAEVAADLRKAGLVVSSLLAEIGVITGQCTAAQAAALRKVAGVGDVTPDAPVDIGPPD